MGELGKQFWHKMRHSDVVQPVRINVYAIQTGDEYAQAAGD
jgi:hypothetical protein